MFKDMVPGYRLIIAKPIKVFETTWGIDLFGFRFFPKKTFVRWEEVVLDNMILRDDINHTMTINFKTYRDSFLIKRNFDIIEEE